MTEPLEVPATHSPDRAIGLRNRLVALAAFVAIAATTLLVFDGVMTGHTISNANYLFAFEPWAYYKRADQTLANHIMSDAIDWPNIFYLIRQIRDGEIPLWAHNEQLGRPGLFIMNNLLVNPIRLFLWVSLGVPVGWTIETLLKFAGSAFFMFLFLREVKVNAYLATAFAISFTFGSNSISSYSDAFAGIPLAAPIVFFFIERVARTRSWWPCLGLMLSLFYVASQALAHIAFFLCYWALLYMMLRVALCRDGRIRLILRYGLPGLASILLFSYALLPSAEFFRNGISLGYREGYGLRQLHAGSLVNVFVANIFGDPLREPGGWKYGTYVNTSIFVGLLAPIGLLAGGIVRALRRREAMTLFALIACVFLFFDIYETPYERVEAFTNSLPLFNGNPAIYQKTILQFFIAVLGALGLQYLWETEFVSRKVAGVLILIATLGSAGLGGYLVHSTIEEIGLTPLTRDYLERVVLIAGLQLVLLLLVIWSRDIPPQRSRIPALIGCALIATCTAEAVVNSRGWIPYARAKDWFPDVVLTDFIKARIGPGRVISVGDGVAVPETLAGYGFPVAAGRGPVSREYLLLLRTAWDELYMYHPTQSLYHAYDTNLAAPIWDLLDVRLFVASRQFDQTQLEKYGGAIVPHLLSDGLVLERVPTPAHARFASDAVVATDPNEIQQHFVTDWDIDTHLVVDSPEALLDGDTPGKDLPVGTRTGTVTNFEQETNSLSFELTSDRPGYAVVSTYHYPGWIAEMDGRTVPIIRAYGFLHAIRVPEPGHHRIALRYRPRSVLVGATISLATFVIVTLAFLGWLVRSRRANAGVATARLS